MPGPIDRRLTLGDLMTLIAATALGLGCFVIVDDRLFGGARYVFGLFRPLGSPNASTILGRAQGVHAMLLTIFGGWTFALLGLAFRRPRAPRRRILRGAGTSACVAATVGVAAVGGTLGLALLIRWVEGRTALPPNYWYEVRVIDCVFLVPGIAVAATWIAQLAAARWRAIPHPLDRLGRCIGLLWVSSAIVFSVRLFLG